MNIYKIRLEGRNCWANLDGTCKRLGFVTIRAEKGFDAHQAANAAHRKLKDELRSILQNAPEDLPEIITGEISEIDEELASRICGAGCTWYPDERPTPN